ncbi:YiiX family permuted papain-like enzyme [Kordia sp.]|uniref:YiiX family permuted papain-like enzyme n=1 Tax=Kordia sp. TaxID=1965332 RepID=UPI0025BB64DB|nr:YiiX family permuted papain-like enzyme [Kordia sp.]MCH2192698.1 YiiX family permuted papain-like enzyme [Kordia sp.]
MKKTLLIIIITAVLGFLVHWGIEMITFADGIKTDAHKTEQLTKDSKIQSGDIIFQTSTSNQSKAIQLATDSKYSHMGIIYENEGTYFVYEAVQPVKLTPLQEWIRRGKNGHYVIKRLANADEILTNTVLSKMKQIGEKFKGKSYDIYFEWSDDKIYCSELVWKIYKEAVNVEIGQLEKLSDFDLNHKVVQAKMKERYGSHIPMNEKVISPAAMFASDKLILVAQN